jgi:hypothetical protein
MNIQLNWFAPIAQMRQHLILKRGAATMAVADPDAVIASARLLIASATEFVPSEYIEENRCINAVYNDRTIIELSIFILFQLDYYLVTNKDQYRDEKIRKSIHCYSDFFDHLFTGSGYEKLIYSRIQLYGEIATHNKNFNADTTQLLKEIILDTLKNGSHRIALLFPYKDNFHLASRLDYHLNVFFERQQNSLLEIYRTIRDTERVQV